MLMERQDEDVVARAVGGRAAAMLRWAAALGDGRTLTRLPYELTVR
jgi:hypothetical protein